MERRERNRRFLERPTKIVTKIKKIAMVRRNREIIIEDIFVHV